MKSGQPHQRYQTNEKAKKEEREKLERERSLRREIQVTGREKQPKAVQRMKNLQKIKLKLVRMRKLREGKEKVVLEGNVVIKKLALERRNQMPKRGRGKRKNRRRKEQSLPGRTS